MFDYSSPDALLDLSYAYENTMGVSFPNTMNPRVYVQFKDPVSVTTVKLQPTYNGKTTNIVDFNITYIGIDGKPYLNKNTANPLSYKTNPNDSSLTIQHEMIHNVRGFNLTVLETSGGPPIRFRLLVLGCYKGSELFCMTLFY